MKKYIVLLLMLVSCGKKSALIFKPNDATTPLPLGQSATFEYIKSTILTPHCLRCHANVTTAAELNKWMVPGNPDASVFFKEVEDGSMPMNAAPIPTSDLELIRSYIQSLVATPTPSTTPVTFAEIKQQVLTPYSCLNCHGVGQKRKLRNGLTSRPLPRVYSTLAFMMDRCRGVMAKFRQLSKHCF